MKALGATALVMALASFLFYVVNSAAWQLMEQRSDGMIAILQLTGYLDNLAMYGAILMLALAAIVGPKKDADRLR